LTKIALLASTSFPIGRPFAGGLEAQTYHLARLLDDRGHDVVLFAAAGSDERFDVRDIVARGTHLRLSDTARADPSMVAEQFLIEHHAYLGAMLELANLDVDVIHNHAQHYLPIAMAPMLRAPLLTTLHTPPTPWLESAIATLPRPHRQAHFVSVSQTNADQWGDVADIGVVANGIPLAQWPFRAEPRGDHLVWSGRIVPEKGTHLAIQAARRAGRRLVLAGPVGDPVYARDHVRPQLGGDVVYRGHLDTPALAALVGSAAAVLVTPCWEEPFGLVAAEALACGTPVAAFDRGALGEVLDPRTGVLAAPDDVTDLARAVDVAVRLDRAACRRRAVTRYSITAMADHYEAIYDRLTGARAAALASDVPAAS
jgi:glycosyltransferase involved in cell wall biosynthesis